MDSKPGSGYMVKGPTLNRQPQLLQEKDEGEEGGGQELWPAKQLKHVQFRPRRGGVSKPQPCRGTAAEQKVTTGSDLQH